MSKTVKELAEEIKTPLDTVLKQLSDAGIEKKLDDEISADESKVLLESLNQGETKKPSKLTFRKKERSTLKVSGSGGKKREVQVEVRKKRTVISAQDVEEQRLVEEKKRLEAEIEAKAAEELKQKKEAEAKAKAKKEAEEKAKEKLKKKRKSKLK